MSRRTIIVDRAEYRESHTYAWRRVAKALRYFVLTVRVELAGFLCRHHD